MSIVDSRESSKIKMTTQKSRKRLPSYPSSCFDGHCWLEDRRTGEILDVPFPENKQRAEAAGVPYNLLYFPADEETQKIMTNWLNRRWKTYYRDYYQETGWQFRYAECPMNCIELMARHPRRYKVVFGRLATGNLSEGKAVFLFGHSDFKSYLDFL